ncbi:hypothetical protein [Pragia fontium]|uniref:hypothetical protein n=1 Tax=Pragia fontium TaxID=82985 RepID=UPI000F6F245B|nr:hypothetical protein [Pragia fontium]VEJ54644.1 Uncharacterised protein [Pragia fontium]
MNPALKAKEYESKLEMAGTITAQLQSYLSLLLEIERDEDNINLLSVALTVVSELKSTLEH